MYSTIKLLLHIFFLFVVCVHARADVDGNRIFRQITAADGIADNSAQTIKCTDSGRMTITTLGNINFYDGSRFSYVSTEGEEVYPLADYHGHYHLYYDAYHHLWLKSSKGVSCVDLLVERYVGNVDSLFALFGAKGPVDDVFIDSRGEVWLCQDGYVFCAKHGWKRPLPKGLNLQDLEVTDDSQLLLFYDNGLLQCCDVASGRLLYKNRAYSDDDAANYYRSGVQTIYNGRLYMIRNGETEAILISYDLKKRQWQVLMRSEFHLNNMVVHDDKLYIASEWGYFTFNLLTGEVNHYKALMQRNGHKLETDINALEFDKQGGMWLGTEQRGLLYSPPVNAPFQLLTWDDPQALEYWAKMKNLKGISDFKGKKANVMLIDSRQWTWVGTPEGLCMYTSLQNEPVVFSKKNGLLNSVIHSVIEDDMHNIWVSTSYGICCIHIVGEKVKQVFCFNNYDNLPPETFINAKAAKMPDGRIVMQGIDHVVTFQPRDFISLLEQKPYEMRPRLTKLLVNGIDVSVGDKVNGDVVLDQAITLTKVINLNYDQNSISMTFSALNFARPLQTYYRVRIREISDKWITYSFFSGNGLVDQRGMLHLPLSALEPGTYHIEVMASVVPDQYVGQPSEWVVNVNQPWWRTTAILSLLGLVVLVMALLNFIVYNRNTRLKVRRNNEEGDVVRRIKAFIDRFDSYGTELMAPTQEEFFGTERDFQSQMDARFVDAMQQIIPYVHELKGKPFSMHMLSKASGLEVFDLCDMVSHNIHKSPRALICSQRLKRVAEMLRTTDKSVETISQECGFVSPNYMISKFFHKYRVLPTDYRAQR